MSRPELPPALTALMDQYHASGTEALSALLGVYRNAVTRLGPDLAAGALATVLEADPDYTRHVLAAGLAHALRRLDQLDPGTH